MNPGLKAALAVATLALASQAMADAMFYPHEHFAGDAFATQRRVATFADVFAGGMDAHDGRWRRERDDADRSRDHGQRNDGDHENEREHENEHDGDRHGDRGGAASAVVFGERWEVCDAPDFRGRCMVLRPGRYDSMAAMGMRDPVASARSVSPRTRVDVARLAPIPVSVYDNRRRGSERLYEADVTSARAVYGVEERRCWIEREQVDAARPRGNGAGAVVGAILGGILGHQVGHGSTRDVATVGGAIAGGAVGYNVGRTRNGEYERDVQRCSGGERTSTPDYWAVTYVFRGEEHAIQVAYDPGDTVTVNRRGEPRASAR